MEFRKEEIQQMYIRLMKNINFIGFKICAPQRGHKLIP